MRQSRTNVECVKLRNDVYQHQVAARAKEREHQAVVEEVKTQGPAGGGPEDVCPGCRFLLLQSGQPRVLGLARALHQWRFELLRPVTNLAARVGKSVPETVRVEDRARLVFSSGISGLGQEV